MVTAASMNSFSRRERIWPRTMRAMVSHSTAPMARKRRMKLRPKRTMRMMTQMVKGRA
jgi:hypothetical protein